MALIPGKQEGKKKRLRVFFIVRRELRDPLLQLPHFATSLKSGEEMGQGVRPHKKRDVRYTFCLFRFTPYPKFRSLDMRKLAKGGLLPQESLNFANEANPRVREH